MLILEARQPIEGPEKIFQKMTTYSYRGPKSHFLYDLCETPQAER